MEDEIRKRLQEAFAPVELEIHNESQLHAGHAGNPGGGNTHFRIEMLSEHFAGKSRVACQREVNQVLKDLMGNPIHALSMSLRAPS